jgi:hypothetical protein
MDKTPASEPWKCVQHVTISHVVKGKKNIPLKVPVDMVVSFGEDGCMMENAALGIVGCAETYDDCLMEVNDELIFVYNEYGKADDNALTKDAQRLKRLILRHFEGTEDEH